MSDIISWDKAIDMKVKSSDNKDLGKIQAITKDYIQTKEGMVSKNYYFIPKYHIQGYDGDRSEERRVGKERRSRWAPYHYKKPEMRCHTSVQAPPPSFFRETELLNACRS